MSIFAGGGRQNFIRLAWTVKYDKNYLEFAKRSGTIINEDVIHDLIVKALGDAWKEARENANAFRDTGFLMDNIYVYMVSNTEGWLAATADYSAAQERGYRNKHGTYVKGKHYMAGPYATAKKRVQEQFNILQKAFVSGVKANFKAVGIPIKTGFPQSVSKPTTSGPLRQATVRKRTRYTKRGFSITRKKVQRPSGGRMFSKALLGGKRT